MEYGNYYETEEYEANEFHGMEIIDIELPDPDMW